jgi:hypothetical protein
LITYLVAAALAIGYVCETGLPSWRRVTACGLCMVLAVGSGHLLTSANPVAAYIAGIPALLALGAVMIAPERTAGSPDTPRRRACDQTGPPTTTGRWQFDRRAAHRRTPTPILTDSRGTHYPGSVTEITAEIAYGAQAVQITRAPAVTRIPGSALANPHRAAEGDLAARRHQRRHGAPRSLSRISRCRCH